MMAGLKYFQVNDAAQSDRLSLKKTLKGILISFILVFILLAGFSLLITYSDISLGLIPVMAKILLYLGALAAGFFASFGKRSGGWLAGLVAGSVYMVLVFVIGLLLRDQYSFSPSVLLNLLIGAIVGAIGGIIGINLKKRR